MRTTIISGRAIIGREIWRSLDDCAKAALLADGDVVLDDEGEAVIADHVLARTIAEVERAVGLR